MKILELYEQNPRATCLIIGGHHGNETIGVDICKKLTELMPTGNGVHIIPIANRGAYVAKTREQNGVDMNRAYDDQSTNILELDEMVEKIKNHAVNATVVIDCHSTPIKDLDEISVYPNLSGAELAPAMGLPFYMQRPPEGSLRYFCDQHEVAMITFEGIDELHDESVAMGVAGIMQLLSSLKVL